MLGLGLRSSQPPGLSSAASPPSVVTEIIGEGFDSIVSNSAISPNPYSSDTGVKWADLPTGWDQGHAAVFGTSNPVVANDITSVGAWTSRFRNETLINVYPLGWQFEDDKTPSSGTGPDGAATSRANNALDNSSTSKFLFTEASGTASGMTSSGDRMFLLRTPGKNYSTEMSASTNILRFSAQIHGHGQNIGDFEVWVDNADRSNTSKAVKLFTFSSDSFSQESVVHDYDSITFDISTIDHPTLGTIDVRSQNDTFYFYIVHMPPVLPNPAGSFWSADMGLDNVYIEEIG